MSRWWQGWTLLELLVVLALAGLLAMASFSYLQQQERQARSRACLERLSQALALARQSALTYGLRVEVCPALEAGHCGHNWQQGQLVHVAEPQLSALTVLAVLPALQAGESLTFHGALAEQRVFFAADGLSAQNGTFSYCAALDEPRYCWQLIINRAGRWRVQNQT
jgi:type IV fimbrial biogenesis protein FimT